MAEEDAQIYQQRAVIRGISPLIWRRLLVRDDSTVAQLHEVLQIAFGWNDEHLNRFEIRGREYAVYREGGGLIGIDARRVRLSFADSSDLFTNMILGTVGFTTCAWKRRLSIPGQRDRRFRRNVTGRSGAT
jgi:hypothetical protein